LPLPEGGGAYPVIRSVADPGIGPGHRFTGVRGQLRSGAYDDEARNSQARAPRL